MRSAEFGVGGDLAKLALRIDDIGASTKVHEQYTESRWLNIGPLKDRRLFGAWGPYREMTVAEWEAVFSLLRKHRAKLTVAVTAAWVESDGSLIEFPEKFPEEAAVLRRGLQEGLIEIAGHGLTHCVRERGLFRQRFFGSNRSYHREFWDWIPAAVHAESVKRCLQILESYFATKIISFVPPGNVYAPATLAACVEGGIQVVNCQKPKIPSPAPALRVVGNESVLPFHDRELVLDGVDWLRVRLEGLPADTQFCFVRDL